MEKIHAKTKTKILALLLAAALLLTPAVQAFACTELYLGADTTDTGAYYYGRTEDISSTFSKLRIVSPAADHDPDTYYVSSTGFKWPYPARTLRYTVTPDSYNNEKITPQPYGEVGMNEAGVAVEGTVTLGSAKAGITSNPSGVTLPGTPDAAVSARNGGWTETDLATVLLMNARTAREGVELAKQIVETVGAGGREGFHISDKDEVWYVEMLSGHNLVGMKLPKDKIGFNPNRTMIGSVVTSDTANFIVTDNFVSYPESRGLLVKDADGNIISNQTYAASSSAQTGRTYLAYYYLTGANSAKTLNTAPQTHLFDPRSAKGYTLYEALRFQSYHGNKDDVVDGQYAPYASGIGNTGTVEAHITEVRDNYPAELAQVEWMAMASPEFSIYVPSYGNLVTEVAPNYYLGDTASGVRGERNENSLYWVSRELMESGNGTSTATAPTAREKVAPALDSLIKDYQTKLITQSRKVDRDMISLLDFEPSLIETVATNLYTSIGTEVYQFEKQALDEIKAWKAAGSLGTWTPSASLLALEPHYSFDIFNGTPLEYATAYLPYVTLTAVDPVDSAPVSLLVGNTQLIGVKFTPINATNTALHWTSNNALIASVDQEGVITAHAPGSATITAFDDYGISLTKAVTVTRPVASVKLLAGANSLTVGSTTTLNSTVLPAAASNKALTYTSLNPAVATVSSSGLITAIAPGTTSIAATPNVGSDAFVSVSITVTQLPVSVAIGNASTETTLTVGDTVNLTGTVAPANTTNKNLVWSVDDAAVAAVGATASNGSAAVLTARKAGTVVVSVKTEATPTKTATLSFRVVEPETKPIIEKPNSVSGIEIAAIPSFVYTGKAITPAPTVTFDGKVLTAATDYSVSYVNNTKVGTATLTVQGKAPNYSGKKTASFKIVPQKTSVKKAVSGKAKITVKWGKIVGTSKYQVAYKVKGAKKWATKTIAASKTQLVLKGLKKGKVYQLRVRSYQIAQKVKYYSAWSAIKTTKKVK